MHDINSGSYSEPSSITLTGWVRDHWLPTIKTQVKPSTFDSYRRNMELHVLPHLGARQLRVLSAPMLNKLYAGLLEDGRLNGPGGLSAKTVRYIHTIIHKALSDAVDAGILGLNIAERSKPPRPRATSPAEVSFWEPPELAQFLDLVRGHRLEAAWHVAAMTGMRRGEVLGLRWQDIDFGHRRISVRQAVVSVAYEVIYSTPKNHRARVIDLDTGTMVQLAEHRRRHAAERYEWGSGYQDADLVFCKEDGSPVHPHSFSQAFERLVAGSELPRIRLHDVRHTHATIALRAGVPAKVISERLGHESPAFTLKQYAHVIPGMQAEAAGMVADLVADSL